MKRLLPAAALLLALHAHAYTGQELLDDCRVAEESFAEAKPGERKSVAPYDALKSTRCISYVSGFADGYAVADFLAGKVGLDINAFCLPKDPDLSRRMVRAVVIHVERTPPQNTVGTATLVAGALAKSFPCPDSLEPKK